LQQAVSQVQVHVPPTLIVSTTPEVQQPLESVPVPLDPLNVALELVAKSSQDHVTVYSPPETVTLTLMPPLDAVPSAARVKDVPHFPHGPSKHTCVNGGGGVPTQHDVVQLLPLRSPPIHRNFARPILSSCVASAIEHNPLAADETADNLRAARD
jgi:hypothetical protein